MNDTMQSKYIWKSKALDASIAMKENFNDAEASHNDREEQLEFFHDMLCRQNRDRMLKPTKYITAYEAPGHTLREGCYTLSQLASETGLSNAYILHLVNLYELLHPTSWEKGSRTIHLFNEQDREIVLKVAKMKKEGHKIKYIKQCILDEVLLEQQTVSFQNQLRQWVKNPHLETNSDTWQALLGTIIKLCTSRNTPSVATFSEPERLMLLSEGRELSLLERARRAGLDTETEARIVLKNALSKVGEVIILLLSNRYGRKND